MVFTTIAAKHMNISNWRLMLLIKYLYSHPTFMVYIIVPYTITFDYVLPACLGFGVIFNSWVMFTIFIVHRNTSIAKLLAWYTIWHIHHSSHWAIYKQQLTHHPIISMCQLEILLSARTQLKLKSELSRWGSTRQYAECHNQSHKYCRTSLILEALY